MQQLNLNRAPEITPVSTYQHISSVGIDFNTKVKLAKFCHKAAFIPSISTFVKSIKDVHFTTWYNPNSNLIQKFLPKITATSKGHLD